MPPFNVASLEELERSSYDKDPRIIYLLYEGQNTEHLVINPLLASNHIINHNHVRFMQIEKTGNDIGITDPRSLIKIANSKIEELISKNEFNPDKDKVLVMFDLDVFKNNQLRMNNLISLKRDEVILAFTNPAIELFLLLTIEDGYEKIIKPHEAEILENNWVLKGKDHNNKEIKTRFICDLVNRELNIDPKNDGTDYSFVLENIDNALEQEKKLNQLLSKAADRLTCNFAYILSKIKNDDYDIEY